MTKHFAFFGGGGGGGREEIKYQRGEDVHKPGLRCDRQQAERITLVNISTCNYNWKGLNESAFPAQLCLS